MASNYVDTAAEEGRFHGHHHSTTPTGAAAASPKHMRRSWSSASSAHGHTHGHGAAPKCVCAPATHAGSFKCRLHRASSHGHPASPPSPAAAATTSAAAVLPHRRGAVTAPTRLSGVRHQEPPARQQEEGREQRGKNVASLCSVTHERELYLFLPSS